MQQSTAKYLIKIEDTQKNILSNGRKEQNRNFQLLVMPKIKPILLFSDGKTVQTRSRLRYTLGWRNFLKGNPFTLINKEIFRGFTVSKYKT